MQVSLFFSLVLFLATVFNASYLSYQHLSTTPTQPNCDHTSPPQNDHQECRCRRCKSSLPALPTSPILTKEKKTGLRQRRHPHRSRSTCCKLHRNGHHPPLFIGLFFPLRDRHSSRGFFQPRLPRRGIFRPGRCRGDHCVRPDCQPTDSRYRSLPSRSATVPPFGIRP